jgi:hypothetical protein
VTVIGLFLGLEVIGVLVHISCECVFSFFFLFRRRGSRFEDAFDLAIAAPVDFECHPAGVVDVLARVKRGEMEQAPNHARLHEAVLGGEDALDERADGWADACGFFEEEIVVRERSFPRLLVLVLG